MSNEPSLSRPKQGLHTLTVPFRHLQNETKAIVTQMRRRQSLGNVEGSECNRNRNRRRSLLSLKQPVNYHVLSQTKKMKEPSTTDSDKITETMTTTTNKNKNNIMNRNNDMIPTKNTLASEQVQKINSQNQYTSPFNTNILIMWLTRLGSILWSCLPSTILYRFYQCIRHYLTSIYQAGSSTIKFPKAPFATLRKWARNDVIQFQQGRGQWKYAFAAGMTKFVYDSNEAAGRKKRQTLTKQY